MRLEIGSFAVRELAFGNRTSYSGGVLTVSREEIRSLVLEDRRIRDVSLELVTPHEDCRITHVCDVLDPRIKVEGRGVIFPGIMGGMDTVGTGKTHRISNLILVTSAEVPGTKVDGPFQGGTGVLDMKDAGASHLNSCNVLALVLTLEPDWADLDYHSAIQLAEMKAAHHLAKATVGLKPESVEVFESLPASSPLPKVVYIEPTVTQAWGSHPGASLYGFPVREAFPTLLQPTELFEGALTFNASRGSSRGASWTLLNHPGARRLYRDHGKRLNFIGVIFQRVRFENLIHKQMTANMTANMAEMLGAQGAIVPGVGSGSNTFLDIAHTVQALEQRGIKTVLMTPESAGERGQDAPLLFYLPEMDAMVSLGNTYSPGKLPKTKRVVGPAMIGGVDAHGEMELRAMAGATLVGGRDSWGTKEDMCVEY